MKRILAAIDGSDIAEKVLEQTRLMGEKMEAEVMVVTVVKRIKPAYHYRLGTDYALSELVSKEVESAAEKIIQHADGLFSEYPHGFQSRILYGEPAEEILVLTEKEQPDLLLMGSRGLGGFGRVMLGSVSTKVLHHATCDVMIIKQA